jgi:hypothetical protein
MSETIVGRFVHDFRFEHPFCCLISGTTGVGKSTFVRNLIEKQMIKGTINEIYYFMPAVERIAIKVAPHQKLYLMEGLPTKAWVSKNWSPGTSKKDVLFIIDDQWDDVLKDKTCRSLCTWGRNHLGFSTMFVTQYYFEQANTAQMMKYFTVAIFIFFYYFRNSIFIFVLFKNNVNVLTNQHIARNLGHEDDYLAAMDEFEDKGVNKHGYVVIRKDIDKPSTPACYSNMFGDIPQLGPNPVLFAKEILKNKRRF